MGEMVAAVCTLHTHIIVRQSNLADATLYMQTLVADFITQLVIQSLYSCPNIACGVGCRVLNNLSTPMAICHNRTFREAIPWVGVREAVYREIAIRDSLYNTQMFEHTNVRVHILHNASTELESMTVTH